MWLVVQRGGIAKKYPFDNSGIFRTKKDKRVGERCLSSLRYAGIADTYSDLAKFLEP